uniref:Ig-like domain-containing protein n=1 Tax=Oryzias latipes TaxID=8090 RepID=A0A3P9JKI6_ORYLA
VSGRGIYADEDIMDFELGWICTNSVQIFWYKQSFGQKPKLMSTFYGHTTKETFSDEFESNSRFKLERENQNPHLKISNLQFSDSATYHCISSDSYSLTFLESFRVFVKDPSSYVLTSVHQSSSENIHAGDSVTLNCTVHTGSCDEEHRVYWFKDSEDSHPGLIYTHGGRNDQCERKNNTQTHSCVYELKVENPHESHAGIYYCAVVSCGHILFGNGTKLDLPAIPGIQRSQHPIYVYREIKKLLLNHYICQKKHSCSVAFLQIPVLYHYCCYFQ